MASRGLGDLLERGGSSITRLPPLYGGRSKRVLRPPALPRDAPTGRGALSGACALSCRLSLLESGHEAPIRSPPSSEPHIETEEGDVFLEAPQLQVGEPLLRRLHARLRDADGGRGRLHVESTL